MKKISLLITMFCLVLAGMAQKDASPRFADLITSESLKKHLTIIAGEEMEGRETGTEGQRKAAAYIEAQFKQMGLKTAAGITGYQQFYPLYQDSLLSSSLNIGSAGAQYGVDYICPAMNNENGTFESNKIVFAGYGIDDVNYTDYVSLDVKGKLVLMFLGEPKKDGIYLVTGTNKSSDWTSPGLSKKLATAASYGAAGVLLINPSQESFNQRTIDNSKKTSVYFPRIKANETVSNALLSHAFAKKIIGDMADSLIRLARKSEPIDRNMLKEISINSSFNYTKSRNIINASNVIGIIEGSDKKDEYVFLTAHYDHLGKRDGKIYYGADDDGSGTVAVMQMAEAFVKAKAAGKGPRRTMVFMTVSGEEKGLWGSEYYSDHPIYPLEKTSVDLNTDMIGRIDTERKKDDTLNYIYVVGHDKLSSELPLINEAMNNKYTQLVFDYKFDDPEDPNRIYYRSDHYNFARKGVPVLFFYDGMLKSDYHKPTDTVDKINWSLFEKRARMIFHTAWEIANRDEMLKRDLAIPTGRR
ncbi:MAG TPA: M28 family peptidase [Ferruginibacter sp.]|nr:M28 family peptidase [Ferruginibacter sp.]